jgi:uncharacterized protein YbjQ (UPF0145 family)
VDILTWLEQNRPALLAALAVLGAIVAAQRAARMMRRYRRPAELNPRLLKYAGRSEAELEADRLAAAKIIATSSTSRIPGFEILQQVEAVFVEGCRAPDEAAAAIKAVAGRLGANAVINLSQQRTAAGKCSAQGDAVRVRPRVPDSPVAGGFQAPPGLGG